MSSPHELLNPPELARPIGFSHAVVAAPGLTVYLAGQAAQLPDGSIGGDTVAQQFAIAAGNLVAALAAAGGRPDHLVSLHIFTTDVEEYRASLAEIGIAYREALGSHYPAVALFGVTELFDPHAKVELVAVAVVPDA